MIKAGRQVTHFNLGISAFDGGNLIMIYAVYDSGLYFQMIFCVIGVSWLFFLFIFIIYMHL